MNWSDDYLSRQKFLRADASVFDDTPEWREKFFTSYAEMGAAYLAIAASDPETLKGVDPDRLVRSQKSGSVLRKTFDRLQMSNGFPWCIASVPIPSWAATVFPELPEDRAIESCGMPFSAPSAFRETAPPFPPGVSIWTLLAAGRIC